MGRFVGGALLVGVACAGGCAYSAQQRASGWSMAETEHVQVRASVGAERAAEVAVEVQRIRDMLAGLVLRCAFEATGDPIRVTVLSESEWRDIAPRAMRGQYRSWRLTWMPEFEAQIVMPDAHDREITQLFQHELTHHMVATCFPSAPSWLHEGLAKFLETITEQDGWLLLGVPPYAIVQQRRRPGSTMYRGVRIDVLSLEQLPSIAEIVTMPSASYYRASEHDGRQLVLNYAASWALVHFLELGAKDLRLRFHTFLGRLRRFDTDPAAAFAQEFEGIDVPARLDAYLRAGDMPYEQHRPLAARKITPRVRPMTSGEAHLMLAWLWTGATNDEDARAHAQEHLAAAREQSDSRARSHLLTAALQTADGDRVSAEREVLAGLDLAPADPDLLHALIELRAGHDEDPVDAAARLAAVARSGEHLCALSGVELRRGEARKALSYAVRGLQARPSSWRCRELLQRARDAIAGPAATPGS